MDRLKAELGRISEANRLLQAENDQLKSIHGISKCDLENRWSNCAARMQQRRELDNSGKHVSGNYTGQRSLANTLFKTSTKHKTPLSR